MLKILDYGIGGFSACLACLFSNPLETVKTRMQLQGEMLKLGSYDKHYKNVFNAFLTIWKNEGFTALQKGLAPALAFQAVMNSIRLGTYETLTKNDFIVGSDGKISFMRCIVIGAFSGSIGSFFASPFYMVKTQLQALSTDSKVHGTQHHHLNESNSIFYIFKSMYSKERLCHNMFRSAMVLWRGSTAILIRTSVGSSSQLASYTITSDYISKKLKYENSSLVNKLISCLSASLFATIGMTPFDVVTTRLCNQSFVNGKPQLYHSFYDCLSKIIQKEGVWALYKGFGASLFRTGPHTLLTLFIWRTLINFKDFYSKK